MKARRWEALRTCRAADPEAGRNIDVLPCVMPWRRRSRLHGLPRSYSFNFQGDRTYHQGRNRSGSRLYIADIETLDEPVLYLEDVDHHSVGQEIALWVTHHLMNFDNDSPLAIGRDLD